LSYLKSGVWIDGVKPHDMHDDFTPIDPPTRSTAPAAKLFASAARRVELGHDQYGPASEMLAELAKRWNCTPRAAVIKLIDLKLVRLAQARDKAVVDDCLLDICGYAGVLAIEEDEHDE